VVVAVEMVRLVAALVVVVVLAHLEPQQVFQLLLEQHIRLP
jgi:hypothetical protein